MIPDFRPTKEMGKRKQHSSPSAGGRRTKTKPREVSTAVLVGLVVGLVSIALVATQMGSSSSSSTSTSDGKAKKKRSNAPSPQPPQEQPKVTPLMAFARRGDLDTVKQIIERLPGLDINAVDPRGMPAVFYALEGRHETILRSVKKTVLSLRS